MPLPPGRNPYFEGKNDGLKIIDSSYNAHLISMESIMDMAAQIKEAEPKWLHWRYGRTGLDREGRWPYDSWRQH